VIARRPGVADHDVGAGGELALLAARIHAADTETLRASGILIEPGEFAMDLQCKLARRATIKAAARQLAEASAVPSSSLAIASP